MRWLLVLALTAAIAATAIACGGAGTNPSGSGTLRVMLKDSPFRDAKALLVTFSEVDVHKSDTPDGTWTKVVLTERTCDLKRLESAVAPLQDENQPITLMSGHYTQVRLVVLKAVVYFDNPTTGDACAADPTTLAPAGSKADVTIPSGEVKLNREFDVPDGGATTLLLDFDGDKSVHEAPPGSGKYMMSPVISVVSAVSTPPQ